MVILILPLLHGLAHTIPAPGPYTIPLPIRKYRYRYRIPIHSHGQGGRLKFSTIIGNAFGKAKQAVSAFFGKQKKNKYSSIARSIYLTAGAFLQGQQRPGHVKLTFADRITCQVIRKRERESLLQTILQHPSNSQNSWGWH